MASDLEKLAKQVEAATGPDRYLDAKILVALQPDYRLPVEGDVADYAEKPEAGDVVCLKGFVGAVISSPQFTKSFDAAIETVPDNWAWQADQVDVNASQASATVWVPTQRSLGLSKERTDCHNAKTATLALCAASLLAHDALRSQDKGEG